jgi:hypothetical protein
MLDPRPKSKSDIFVLLEHHVSDTFRKVSAALVAMLDVVRVRRLSGHN